MPPESNEDARNLFFQYKNRLRDVTKFKVTFNQQYAYEHKSVDFMNIYHPLVMAAASYFGSNIDVNNSTYCLRLKEKDAEFKAGRYFLAVYQVSLSKTVYGMEHSTESLVPILYDLDKETIVDSSLLASKIQGQAQIKGSYLSVPTILVTPDQIEILRSELLNEIDSVTTKMKEDESIRIETDKNLQAKRTKELYEARIHRYETNIETRRRWMDYSIDEKEKAEARNTINLLERNKSALEDEMESKLASINNMGVNGISDKLFSLSYVLID